ncbi:MAG TPA: hypothetical protein VFS40_07745, partial [Gemmatimonadales bacterium]|nr:hypothetical protein [Gemmatimonadales bacterium]
GDRPGDVAVVLGAEPADLAPFFAETTVAARVDDSWAVERHVPIVVARGPRAPLQAVWPRLAGRN